MLKLMTFVFLFVAVAMSSACTGPQQAVVPSEMQVKAERDQWRNEVRAWGRQYREAIAKYQSVTEEADIATVIDQLKIAVATAPTEAARLKAADDLCVVAAGLADVALVEQDCLAHEPLKSLLR